MLDYVKLRTKDLGQEGLSPDSIRDNARAKAVRASYEFWTTGNEALLEQAFGETFAEQAAPPCETGTNGSPPNPPLRDRRRPSAPGPGQSGHLEHVAFRRNRHCEERSDEAIQGTKGALRSPGSRRFARDNDVDGLTVRRQSARGGR